MSPTPADSHSPEPQPVPVKRKRSWLGRLCATLVAAGVIVTAIAWLLPFHRTQTAGVYDVFAAVAFFTRVFLIPMACGWLALGVVAAVLRRFKTAAVCVAMTIAWAAPEAWMAWPREKPFAGPTFSVASFNLNKDLKDATWAAEVMRQMDADFVVLQEVSPTAARQVGTTLDALYPHKMLYPDTGFNGMVVLSKTPLTLLHAPENDERRNLEVATTALGRELVLIDVHLAPPQATAKRRRNRGQVRDLLDQYADDKRPVVLAGDFNFTAMTPQAFALRRAGFQDGALEAGRGRQATWPAKSATSPIPTVRIDTVYARGPLIALKAEVGPDVGSDHLPIKTTWKWAD